MDEKGTVAGRARKSSPGVVLLAALLIATSLLALPRAARADLDVTNRWIVRIVPAGNPNAVFTCTLDFTQTAGDFAAHGPCDREAYVDLTGTIDPSTGALGGSGVLGEYAALPFPTFLSFTLSGSVAPSGTTMSATLTGEIAGTFAGTLCQNGHLDPGEQCDDGFATNGCCADTCTFRADGTSCSSNQCQTATSCATGACIGTPRPVGTACDRDANTCTTDSCDATGTCAAGPCSPCCGGASCTPQARFSCAGPTTGRGAIQIKNSSDGRKDRVTFTIPRADATDAGALGDPTTSTDYDLCVYWIDEEEGAIFLADARAPAGRTCGTRPCWKRSANGTISYRDPTLSADGIASLKIKPGAAGKGSLSFVARGQKLALPKILGPLPGGDLEVEVRNADACWNAHFLLGSEPRGVNSSTELAGKQGFGF